MLYPCSIRATLTLISHGHGSCRMTSIQYDFMIYVSDRVRLIRLSMQRYKQSVRYLQTMLKRYVQHNYFQNQLSILAPIYKQTGQFVGTFYAGNIILQRIEMHTYQNIGFLQQNRLSQKYPTPGKPKFSWLAFAIFPTKFTLLGAQNIKLSQNLTNVVITYIWA